MGTIIIIIRNTYEGKNMEIRKANAEKEEEDMNTIVPYVPRA